MISFGRCQVIQIKIYFEFLSCLPLLSKKFLFVLTIPFLLHGIDPNINALEKLRGLNHLSFSETGFPYLRIKYADINTVKPKLGFLKFGIAF